MFTVVTG